MNRRNFIKGTAAALAVAPLAIAAKPEFSRGSFDGWEWMEWTGENVKEILDFGDSGPCPLWGDDFKVVNKDFFVGYPDTVHFTCFHKVEGYKWVFNTITEIAYPGDFIIRSPEGYFHRLPKPVNDRSYSGAYLEWKYGA